MTPHETMLENVAVYALGSLPPSEAHAVRAHLRTCAECRTEYIIIVILHTFNST